MTGITPLNAVEAPTHTQQHLALLICKRDGAKPTVHKRGKVHSAAKAGAMQIQLELSNENYMNDA